MSNVVQAHNVKAQSVWNSAGGRYDEISRNIADAIEHAVARLQPETGERILDLATGTGWGSRLIAQRFPGVKVTGADIADVMLDYARSAAAKEELDIDYRHADAESLPFADRSFDGVISTFGVMFVGKPEAAAAELARVVRPGGRIVLATWKHDSNVFQHVRRDEEIHAASAAAAAALTIRVGEVREAERAPRRRLRARVRGGHERLPLRLRQAGLGPLRQSLRPVQDARGQPGRRAPRRARARLRRLARDVQEGPRLRAAAPVHHHARQAALRRANREAFVRVDIGSRGST